MSLNTKPEDLVVNTIVKKKRKDLRSFIFSNDVNVYDYEIADSTRFDRNLPLYQSIYVDAVYGDDKNNGDYGSPIKSLVRMLELIAKWKLTAESDCNVVLRAGIYEIDKTLLIGTEHCHPIYNVNVFGNEEETIVICPKMLKVEDGKNPLGKKTYMAYGKNLRPMKNKTSLGKKYGKNSLGKNLNLSLNYTDLGNGYGRRTIALDESDQDILKMTDSEIQDMCCHITHIWSSSQHLNDKKFVDRNLKTLNIDSVYVANSESYTDGFYQYASSQKLQYGAPYELYNYKYGIGEFYTSDTNFYNYSDEEEEIYIPIPEVQFKFYPGYTSKYPYNWNINNISFTGFHTLKDFNNSMGFDGVYLGEGSKINVTNCKFIYSAGLMFNRTNKIKNNIFLDMFCWGIVSPGADILDAEVTNNLLFNIGTRAKESMGISCGGVNLTVKDNFVSNFTWVGINMGGQSWNPTAVRTGICDGNVTINAGCYSNEVSDHMLTADGGGLMVNGRNDSIIRYKFTNNISINNNYNFSGRAIFLDDSCREVEVTNNILGFTGNRSIDARNVNDRTFNNLFKNNILSGNIVIANSPNGLGTIFSKNYITSDSKISLYGNVSSNGNEEIKYKYEKGVVIFNKNNGIKNKWLKLLVDFNTYESDSTVKAEQTTNNAITTFNTLLNTQLLGSVFNTHGISNFFELDIKDNYVITNNNYSNVSGIYANKKIKHINSCIYNISTNPFLLHRIKLIDTSGYFVEKRPGYNSTSSRKVFSNKVFKLQKNENNSGFTQVNFTLSLPDDFTFMLNISIPEENSMSNNSTTICYFGEYSNYGFRIDISDNGYLNIICFDGTKANSVDVRLPNSGFLSLKVRFKLLSNNTWAILYGDGYYEMAMVKPTKRVSILGFNSHGTEFSAGIEVSCVRLINNITNKVFFEALPENIIGDKCYESITGTILYKTGISTDIYDTKSTIEHYNILNMEGYCKDSSLPLVNVRGAYNYSFTGNITSSFLGKFNYFIPSNSKKVLIPDAGIYPYFGYLDFNTEYFINNQYYICVGPYGSFMEIHKGIPNTKNVRDLCKFDNGKTVYIDADGKVIDTVGNTIKMVRNSKNLFNPNTITTDAVLTNTEVLTTLADSFFTDYIPVLPVTSYYSNKTISYVTYYDVNKTLITGGVSTNTNTFTTTNQVRYVIVSLAGLAANKSTLQIEQGTSGTTFEPYSKVMVIE